MVNKILGNVSNFKMHVSFDLDIYLQELILRR